MELLVALVLFAILSSALFSALHIGANSLDLVTKRANSIEGLSAADAVLQKTLLAAYPEYIPNPVAGMAGTVAFDGNPHFIVFLAPAPRALASGGLARFRLSVEISGTTKNLVLAAQPELGFPDQKLALREILAPNLLDASISYWGADTPNTISYWHTSWHDREYLPRLIRIDVAFGHEDSRSWPALIFAPRVRADQSCQFVTQTQSCLDR